MSEQSKFHEGTVFIWNTRKMKVKRIDECFVINADRTRSSLGMQAVIQDTQTGKAMSRPLKELEKWDVTIVD